MTSRGSDAPVTGFVHCEDCVHMRARPVPDLPPNALGAHLVKAQTRLHQLSLELLQRERIIVEERRPFEYEPFFYQWCENYSTPAQRVWFPCAVRNPRGSCEGYEAGSS
jgi:hypothetical protein